VALNANALVSLIELKDYLRIAQESHSLDTRLENVVAEASAAIERRTRRKIAYRGTVYTEFHTVREPSRFHILTLNWPIITVTSLSEDTARVYGATTALVEGTDFAVDKTNGRITRASAGSETFFTSGFEVLKLVYSAGYAPGLEQASIPPEWKNACLRTAARIWREEDRKTQGIASYSDQLGNVTRYRDAMIPDDVAAFLDDETRQTLPTGREG